MGVSNVLDADAARRLTGAARPFMIRPEKIRFLEVGETLDEGLVVAAGVVEHLVYLGAATRYAVRLDTGGQLLVLRQNADDGPGPGPGQPVRVAWPRRHHQALGG